MKSKFLIPVFAIALFSAATAQEAKQTPRAHDASHAVHRPAEIKWLDGPASLPPGAKFALLEGYPAKGSSGNKCRILK